MPPSNIVAAYNATSGALLWKDALPGTGYTEGAAVIANHLVYVASSAGTEALNPSNGHVVWSSPIATTDAGPAVDGGTLVESADNGTLYAVNATSGAGLWHVAGDGGGAAVPAIANGVVYISGFNDSASTFVPLRARNEVTGALLWTNASSVSSGFGGPSEANGTVFLGTSSGVVAFGL
jgi:outer membrane protein assembly factor BamB